MFEQAAGIQLITGALVLIFCSLLQMYYQPYCRSRQNWMEFISLTVAFLSMMMGLYLQYPSLSDGLKTMIRGYIISSTLGIVIWFLYLILDESFCFGFKNRLSSVPLHSRRKDASSLTGFDVANPLHEVEMT